MPRSQSAVLAVGSRDAASRGRPADRCARRATAVQPATVIRDYCVTCHNGRLKTGNLALDRSTSPTRRRTPRCGRRWSASCAPGRCRLSASGVPIDATYQHVIGVAGDRARSRRGRPPESRPAAHPPPEPHRVRQRHPGSARARHRRRDVAPARRRFLVRLRQHRRRAGRVAAAAGALPRRRRSHQRAGRGRHRDSRAGSDTFRLRQDLSQDQAHRGTAARDGRRARRSTTPSRSTASTPST